MLYLIDTNILIYASKGLIPEHNIKKTGDIFIKSYNISVISEIELLGCKNLEEEQFFKLKKFISFASRFDLTDDIKYKTIELKRRTNLKTPDAIIAATAIINNFTLVTRNIKDFKNIEDLKIYNPFEIEDK